MKMKKFLASVLSVLMLAQGMSYAAYAQETGTEDTGTETTETVTITFDAQNGAFKRETVNGVKNTWVSYAVSTAEVAVGETITFPATPSYVYHEFQGWSTEVGGATIDTADIKATADTTYYGVWKWNKADDGTPLASKLANKQASQMAGENSNKTGPFYDATTDTVYARFTPKNAGNTGSCNMYSGINYSIPGTELYMAAQVRTNMTASSATAGICNSSRKNGTQKGYPTMTAADGYAYSAEDNDEWVTIILKSTGIEDFGIGTHIDFDVAGSDPADDLANDYYDVAGMALFATQAEAEKYAIANKTGYTGDAVVKFDAQLTADDDTDVYTEYPANLENEGNALVGWTLDPTAETIEYVDLTALAVPTEDVTYYAVWNEERTINFYKNDGTDAVETLTLGKGAAVTVPSFTSDGKLFLGWAEAADSTTLVDVQQTAETSADYYAVWLNDWLTKVVVNGNDYGGYTNGRWYGISGLTTADRLDFVMPYGYPTSIIPTIVATDENGAEAIYTAPATFDGEGSVVVGERTIPVTFTVADRDTVEDMTAVPTASVNSGGHGAYAIKENTDKGISATKYIPIYSVESEYYEDGTYMPTKATNAEGWGVFPFHNMESYKQYRVLVYYDDGGDGKDDTSFAPHIYVSNAHTRGTLRNKSISAVQAYKTNRWEYIYFNVPEGTYGLTGQFSYNMMGGKIGSSFKNDVYYIAEVAALVEADEELLQYKPMGLSSTNETNAKNDGTITGVTSDMEIKIGDAEYTSVAGLEKYNAEIAVISGLAPGTYSVRYAGYELKDGETVKATYAASEAVELTIEPDSVEIYFEDGDSTTEVVEQTYEYGAAIAAPTSPVKTGYKFAGWALEGTETAYDFANATAVAELDGKTFNAIWERITSIYVDGTVEASGDGFTADTPVKTFAEAVALVSDAESATINIAGDVVFATSSTQLELKGVDLTITSAEDAALVLGASNYEVGFYGTGSVKLDNLTIDNTTNAWFFLNFSGLDYEIGNIAVEGNPLNVRSAQVNHIYEKDGTKYLPIGDKVTINSGNYNVVYLAGNGEATAEDIDFEFRGGTVKQLRIGNDGYKVGGVAQPSDVTLSNVKLLVDGGTVTNVDMPLVTAINGAYQYIANNDITVKPTLSVEAAGGAWIINSAKGGRVDFTETAGTFKVTTDKTYAVIIDAEGVSTKYRMADGVSGDANLYADEASLELTLPAGDYTVTYTNEGVGVKVLLPNNAEGYDEFTLNAANNYTVAVTEAAIDFAEANVPAGYIFTGEFESMDGKYRTADGALKVTEYTAEEIVLMPVYEEDDTLPYYHSVGLYNEKLATYDVTVSIANGKFVTGTVGGIFNTSVLEYTGYTLGEEIGNDLLDAPEIVKDAMYDGEDDKFVLVWNAKAGSIDATENDVEIITFHYNVKDAEMLVGPYNDLGVSPVAFYHPDKAYDGYFDGEYYQASPVLAEGEDQFAVNYVDVYEGKTTLEYALTEPAVITVKVTMADKLGETVDDFAYLAYSKVGEYNWKFIALEDEGNTEKTIEKVISDVFYVGETYTFTILKNGYTGSELKTITLEDGMTFTSEILGGDIKESYTGANADAVDPNDFGDGEVTLSDFVRVVRAFDDDASGEYRAIVDINEDGNINVEDIAIVKERFGATYEDVEIVVTTTAADGE